MATSGSGKAENRRRPPAKKKKEKSRVWHRIGMVFLTLFLVGIITGGIVIGAFLIYVQQFIDPSIGQDLANVQQDLTSFIYYYDKDGNEVELERLSSKENRVRVDLEQIPKYLQDAFICIEDKRFREHNGVDWRRTISATLNFFLPTGKVYGASTITQQLIKNITGDDTVSPKRKIQEIVRALKLEEQYEKDDILESYLNTIFLSQGCYGVQTAAETYFGKDVSQLNLAECASIAGITQYPTKYDPFLHPENNKERQEVVLNTMLEEGVITQEECEEAKAYPLVFNKEEVQKERESKQSYYVDQIIDQVLSDLQTEKKYSKNWAKQVLYSGGLKIYAAVDMDVQTAIEEVFVNEENYPEVKTEAKPEASMVVMDPYTGRVLGLVGGRGEKTLNRGLNRATQTYRQPGSSIKPISVYAPAIEYGVTTMGSVYDDSPYDIEQKWPKNYYSQSKGLMTVQEAVEQSTNTVAVKILAALKPEVSFQFMEEKLGVTSLRDKDPYLAPLALGGLTKGMSVLEMTAAYQPFVNKGLYSKPFTYYKVEDSEGNIILENKVESTPAVSEQTAFIITQLLRSAVQRGTATPAQMGDMPVAGKTGTTNDDKDRWFVGYSPYYVGAVWFGYDTPEEIKVSGGNPALNLWKKVMVKIHDGLESKSFEQPSGVVQANYCKDSGKIATAACNVDPRGNRVRTAWYKEGTQPTESCDVHILTEICTESNCIASAYCPEESRKTVGLLNYKREFPYEMYFPDAGFTYLPLPDGFVPSVDDNPIYLRLLAPGMSPGSLDGTNMNRLCPIHTELTIPDDPENPDDPNQPDDPNNPDPPGPDNPDQPDDPNNPDNPQPPVTDPTDPTGGGEEGNAPFTPPSEE